MEKHILRFNEINENLEKHSLSLINKYQKMVPHESELMNLILPQAIEMLENDVNPDKVKNWINNISSSYDNKPVALSAKEKANIERKKLERVKRGLEKQRTLDSLSERLQSLIDDNGIKIFALLDWKAFTLEEYDTQEEKLTQKGYHMFVDGDGAFEIIISTKKLSKETISTFRELENDIDELDGFYSLRHIKSTAKHIMDKDIYLEELEKIL